MIDDSGVRSTAANEGRGRAIRAMGKLLAFVGFAWLARLLLVNNSPASAVLVTLACGCALLIAVRPKAPSTGPDWAAFSASLSVTAFVALPPNIRDAVIHSWTALGLVAPIAFHLVWGAARGIRAARLETNGRTKLQKALGEIVPEGLAKVAAAELTIIGYAFHWTGAVDVPLGASGFSYHRLVSPMMWAFLCLALIEITVVHLLVSMWSTTAAWILFILSDISLLYLLGLISSLRRLPVLLDGDRVRVRTGILYDFSIPLSAIIATSANFASDELHGPGTLKTSLLAYPNVLIEVSPPLPSPKPFGKGGPVSRVALALDDHLLFLNALRANCRSRRVEAASVL